MPQYPCPICGDPNAYPLWIDKQPPTGCSEGEHVRSVTECTWQMNKARAEKARRQISPWAFDEAGNIRKSVTVDGEYLDGSRVIGRVTKEVWDAGFNIFTGLPEKIETPKEIARRIRKRRPAGREGGE